MLFRIPRSPVVLALTAAILFTTAGCVGAELSEVPAGAIETDTTGGDAPRGFAADTPATDTSAAAALLSAVSPAEAPDAAFSPWPETGVDTTQACCRICRRGKACGDSCINRQLRCHQPPGCACDG